MPLEDLLDRKPSARSQIAVAVPVAIAVGLVAFVALPGSEKSAGKSESGSTGVTVSESAPVATSRAGLVALAARRGGPVFWAGDRPGETLELRQASDRSVRLRYLTAGTPLGAKAQKWLTVVTYPEPNPYAQVAEGATREGANSHRLPGGGLLVSPPGSSTDVFFAGPGSHALVEVYDPTAGVASREVLSGRVRPVS